MKFLVSLFLGSSLILLVFQTYLATGLLWNFLDYFIIFICFLILLFSKKYVSEFIYKGTLLVFTLGIISIIWVKFHQNRLNKSHLDKEISLMTYNLYFKNKYKNATIKLIEKENPDILFVQELTPNWEVALDSKIRNKYPYKSTIASRGTHGIGIYSKYKIINKKVLKNKNNKVYAQIINILINNKNIQFANTHLASPAVAVENSERFFSLYHQNYKIRKMQLKNINNYCLNSEKKVHASFIIGDLNTMKYEPIFRELSYNWTNIYDKVGQGLGLNFPNSAKFTALITLDYILAHGNVKGIYSKVIKGGSSDHFAILTKVKI